MTTNTEIKQGAAKCADGGKCGVGGYCDACPAQQGAGELPQDARGTVIENPPEFYPYNADGLEGTGDRADLWAYGQLVGWRFAQRAASVPAETVLNIGKMPRYMWTAAGMAPTLLFGKSWVKFEDIQNLAAPVPAASVQAESDLVKRLTHERDALGQAIADAAQKAGMYNGEVSLSGPHLIDFAQHLGEAATVPQDIGRDAALVAELYMAHRIYEVLDKDLSNLHTRAAERLKALATQPANVAHGIGRDTVRLNSFIDWYLRGGQRAEIHADGHMVQTTRAIVLAALDSMAANVTQAAPSTLAQQVASAQAEVDAWPDGKLARVKLAGGDQV